MRGRFLSSFWVIVLLFVVACRHNAYYNFTEYAKYTHLIDGPRVWHHIRYAAGDPAGTALQDTAFSVVYIDNATISIGETRLHFYRNTDSTIIFTTHSSPADTNVNFNFRNNHILFHRLSAAPEDKYREVYHEFEAYN